MSRSSVTRNAGRARIRAAVALVFCAAMAIVPSAPASATVYGAVSGTISVAGLGSASGGCVTLYNSAGIGVTGADCTGGSYNFASLTPGQYYLYFTGYANAVNEWWDGASGWYSATAIAVTSGTNTVTNVTLARSAVISGTLTVAGAGAATGGCVTAYVDGTYADEGCTVSGGTYSLTHLRPATNVVLDLTDFVGAANVYYPAVAAIYDATGILTGAAGSTTTVDDTLPAATLLSGVVTEAGGTPIDGACVYVYAHVASGDSYVDSLCGGPDGAYQLSHMLAGAVYRLAIWRADLSQWGYYNGAVSLSTAALVGLPGNRTLNITWGGADLFPDVTSGNAFKTEIEWMSDLGISTGYGDGTFRPTANVSRQAMAAFMYRFAGSPAFTPPVTTPFNDVATDSAFYKEITWMADQGISTGYGDGGFHPTANVSRQAMSAFMYRFAGSPVFSPPVTSPFNDVATGSTFYAEITWMADQAITTGYGDGGFHPAANVSRQAMAAFMSRLSLVS